MSSTRINSVSKILKRKVVHHIDSSFLILPETVIMSTACSKMQKNKTKEIIVIDNARNPIGIVTDYDILNKIGEAYANPNNTRLDDIMTFPIIGISFEDTLQDALNIMKEGKIRKLVVFGNEGKVLGFIRQSTITNLIRQNIRYTTSQKYLLKAISWNIGTVTQFAGVLMLIPSILATVLNDTVEATGIFLMSSVLLITGFFLNSYGDKYPLNLRGTAIMVFASFFILIMIGTIPYLYIAPYETNSLGDLFANSFFSSTSSFTTAGISLFSTPEELPDSFTFFRSFCQFVGGLSFIYLIMTAFYPENKLIAIRGFISGDIPKLKDLFVIITIVFSIYTIIIALLMFYFGERDIIDDFALAMSTLSTGGFVPDSHLFPTLIFPEYLVLMAGMILGALPFGFHYAFFRKKFMSVKSSSEVGIYLAILAGAILLFIGLTGILEIDAVFTVISTSTTEGFQIIDFNEIGFAPMILLIVLMIIGGCGFSTAGGLKVFRLQQLCQLRHLGKLNWIALKPKERKEIWIALILLVLFPTIPIPVAYHLSSQGYDLSNSYFESLGAITTAGLGTGIIDIDLDPISKILVSFLMILGRLEIILLAYIFVPKLVS